MRFRFNVKIEYMHELSADTKEIARERVREYANHHEHYSVMFVTVSKGTKVKL
jgi:hypothetical protein